MQFTAAPTDNSLNTYEVFIVRKGRDTKVIMQAESGFAARKAFAEENRIPLLDVVSIRVWK